MRRKGYKLLSGLLTAVMLAGVVGPIPAKAAPQNGWEYVDGNWYWYENGVKQGTEGRGKEIYDPESDAWYWLDAIDNGKKAVSKDVYQESLAGDWAECEDGTGKWVRYDEHGHMIKGWSINESGTYYFDLIYGTMAKGTVAIDGAEYTFDSVTGVLQGDSPIQNGWQVADGNWYWYENGVKQGTEGRGKEIYDPESDAWYWLDAVDGGKKATGKDMYQESLAGDWAENEDGTGKWVRYDDEGHMIKGWYTNDNGTYYFDFIYGTMAKGNVVIDGKPYTFDSVTGILQEQAVVEYGWMTIDGNDYWYENGVRQGTEGRGKEIYDPGSDAWYWLDAVDNGKKAVSKDVYQESLAGDWAECEDGTGKWVRYDAEGHMIKGWSSNDNGTYYFDLIYGTMAKGVVTIDGKWYEFDKVTGVLIGETEEPSTTDENTGNNNGGNSNTGNNNGGNSNTGNNNGGNSNTGNNNGGNSNTGNNNGGNSNTGNNNGGNSNTGNNNGGNSNTGNSNGGNSNTGNSNGGNSNTENNNGGNSNTGNDNGGNSNTGNNNGGNSNTGNDNSGNNNTGDDSSTGNPNTEEYHYTEAVVEELVSYTDYRVEAQEGAGGELVLPENAKTSQLEKGDILVLPANSQWQEGLILKVSETYTENGEVRITGEVPTDPLEVYDSVSLKGTAQADISNVTPAEGVTYRFVGSEEKLRGSLSSDSLGLKGESITVMEEAMEFDILDTDAISSTLSMQIPEISYEIEYDANSVTKLNIEMPSEIVLNAEVKAEYSEEIEVGTLRFILPAGFTVELNVVCVIDIEGTASLEFRFDNVIGVDYVNGELKPIAECTPHQTIEISANAKTGVKVEIGVYFAKGICETWDKLTDFFKGEDDEDDDIKPIYNVGAEMGYKISAALQQHVEVNLTCINVGAHLYLDLYVGEGSVIGDGLDLKKTWEIINEDVCPTYFHFEKRNQEKMELVDECTYESLAWLSDCNVVLMPDVCVYDGTTKKPTVVVTNGISIVPSSEYTVYYSDNVEVGTATVRIVAKNGSSVVVGETTETFTIVESEEDSGETGDTESGEGDNSGDAGNTDDTEGEEAEKTETIKYSGEEHGLSWKITETGKLIVTGTCDSPEDIDWTTVEWVDYKEEITDAEIKFDGATHLSKLFYSYRNLESVDASELDTSEVTDMSYMFYRCDSLSALDLNTWDTSKVTTMFCMFSYCTALKELDITNWNTGQLIYADYMFSDCKGLNSLDVSKLDTSNLSSMTGMFMYCSGLSTLDVSEWDTGKVTNMGAVFEGCSQLSSVDVSNWNTSNVKFMSHTFSGCGKLSSLDVSGWNTENVTDMISTFRGCTNLSSLNLSSWDTSKVTTTKSMFYGCSGLTSLNLSGWNLSKVTIINEMFYNCSGLSSLDLREWDTEKVTNMSYAFYGCTNLTEILVGSGWKIGSETKVNNMFDGCGTDQVTLKTL